MKSNPCKPERFSRRAIFSAAADISALSIKRRTVEGPEETVLLITSKWRVARISPFQQATEVVASRPATNVCAFTIERRRSNEGQTRVVSRSIKARLAARARSGGACKERKARLASLKVRKTLVPSSPEETA